MKKLYITLGCVLLSHSLLGTRIGLDEKKIIALGDKLIRMHQPPRVASAPAKLFISKMLNHMFTSPTASFSALETQEDVNEMIKWMNDKNENVTVTWYYLDNRDGKHNFQDLQKKNVRFHNHVFNDDGTTYRLFTK